MLDLLSSLNKFSLNEINSYPLTNRKTVSIIMRRDIHACNVFAIWLLQLLLSLQPMPSVQSSTASNKTAIHIAAFLPYTSSRKSYLGLDQIESVKKALIDINDKENMLPDYELKVIFYYTKVG